MQNGYYTAVGAMVTQFNRLDIIANNLANVDTVAFKKDDIVVGDFKRIFDNQFSIKSRSTLNLDANGIPKVSEQYTEFKQGDFKPTGNQLDFALKNENTFFLVDTKDGVRLTQNGSFKITSDGTLTTQEGYKIASSTFFQDGKYIKIEPNNSFRVEVDGSIYSKEDKLLGKFYIAKNSDMKSLIKDGNGLYKSNDIGAMKQVNSSEIVTQGFLETSNINPVREMVNLIDTHRMVEMYQKVMTSHMNELNSDAINKLAQTRA